MIRSCFQVGAQSAERLALSLATGAVTALAGGARYKFGVDPLVGVAREGAARFTYGIGGSSLI
jgi:hypothetical protein